MGYSTAFYLFKRGGRQERRVAARSWGLECHEKGLPQLLCRQ